MSADALKLSNMLLVFLKKDRNKRVIAVRTEKDGIDLVMGNLEVVRIRYPSPYNRDTRVHITEEGGCVVLQHEHFPISDLLMYKQE